MTEVAGSVSTAQLSLSPYVYYAFRVLAMNRIGYSEPSQPSSQYRTSPAGERLSALTSCEMRPVYELKLFALPRFSPAPELNPSDVQGRGTKPSNLVITWTVGHTLCL